MLAYQEMLKAAGVEWETIQSLLDSLSTGTEDVKSRRINRSNCRYNRRNSGIISRSIPGN